MSLFISAEDGYYALTSVGIALCVILIVALIVLTALIRRKDKDAPENIQETDKTTKQNGLFSTKQLVFSAMAIALGYATSYVKLLPMPWGGSITL